MAEKHCSWPAASNECILQTTSSVFYSPLKSDLQPPQKSAAAPQKFVIQTPPTGEWTQEITALYTRRIHELKLYTHKPSHDTILSLPVSGRRVQAQQFICGAMWNELLGQQITGSICWSTNKDVRSTQFVLHLRQIKCKHIMYSTEQINIITDHVQGAYPASLNCLFSNTAVHT